MKKYLTLLAFMVYLAVPRVHAQVIDTVTNANFEVWNVDALESTFGVDSIYDPNNGYSTTGWWDLNMLNTSFAGGSPVSVRRDSLKVKHKDYKGRYSAEISTVILTHSSDSIINKYGINYSDTVGIMLTANISYSILHSSLSITRGIPYTAQMLQLNFWYQYAPVGNDTAWCFVYLKKKGKVISDTGVWFQQQLTNSWTPGTVSITKATAVPDTAVIIFSSSTLKKSNSKSQHPGSTFWIDSVTTVNSSAGINEINTNKLNVNVYPDPAKTIVNFTITGETANTIEMYDVTGRILSSYPVRNNLLSVSVLNYNTGLYFYRLLDKSGALLTTGKFSVVK
jgi:hypothetical protein